MKLKHNIIEDLREILALDYAVILLLGVYQGLLSTLSLAPFNLPFLAWLAPWPFFYFSRRFHDSIPKLFLAGAVSSFFLCIFSFYWMLSLFKNFGDLNLGVSLLIFVPYTVLLNLKSPLFVILLGLTYRSAFRRYTPLRWFVAGLLGLLTDFLTPQIFPWYWGNLLAGNPWLSQIAEVTGIYGLSFIMFAGSYVFYRLTKIIFFADNLTHKNGFSPLARIKKLFRRPILVRLLPVPLVLIVLLVGGAVRKTQMEKAQADFPRVRVAAIQANAPLESGSMRELVREIRDLIQRRIPNLVNQAGQAAEGKLDLIVLPESAVPYVSADPTPLNGNYYRPSFEKMLMLLSYNWNADVYFNEITFTRGDRRKGEPRKMGRNSSALYGRDGRRHSVYHKRKLLAFGEYIPGTDFLKKTGLIKLVPGAILGARFHPGDTSHLIPYGTANRENPFTPPGGPLNMRDIPAGPREFESAYFTDREFKATGAFMPLICYEVLSPEHVRSFFHHRYKNGKTMNPDFLVNVTQDGWYGDSIETYQHYELGRIRSLETRRALVRSTNSGSSGFIDIAGNYVRPMVGPRLTGQEVADIQIWDVPVNRETLTIYVRYGNKWILIPVIALLSLIALRARRQMRRHVN